MFADLSGLVNWSFSFRGCSFLFNQSACSVFSIFRAPRSVVVVVVVLVLIRFVDVTAFGKGIGLDNTFLCVILFSSSVTVCLFPMIGVSGFLSILLPLF